MRVVGANCIYTFVSIVMKESIFVVFGGRRRRNREKIEENIPFLSTVEPLSSHWLFREIGGWVWTRRNRKDISFLRRSKQTPHSQRMKPICISLRYRAKLLASSSRYWSHRSSVRPAHCLWPFHRFICFALIRTCFTCCRCGRCRWRTASDIIHCNHIEFVFRVRTESAHHVEHGDDAANLAECLWNDKTLRLIKKKWMNWTFTNTYLISIFRLVLNDVIL